MQSPRCVHTAMKSTKRVFIFVISIIGVIILTVLLNLNGLVQNPNPKRQRIAVDHQDVPSQEEILSSIEHDLPSLPMKFIEKSRGKRMNATCALFPRIMDINIFNTYWQTYVNGNVTFQIFGAYYDKRKTLPEGPVVRVLAMVNEIDGPYPSTYCQLWYDDRDQPTITAAIRDYYLIWYKEWGHRPKQFYPYILTCVLPVDMQHLVPQTVSLVGSECASASNNIKVVFEEPEHPRTKLSIGVCVKGLDYQYNDLSVRLVEWLELIRLLGAEKVYLYEMKVHSNIKKVLNYYSKTGFAAVADVTMAIGAPLKGAINHFVLESSLLNKHLNELITYNDCLYRNMYKYDYIAVIDIDEVIMPLGNLISWFDIIRSADKESAAARKCKSFASYCFKHVYYPRLIDSNLRNPDVPGYLYMLQQVRRNPDLIFDNTKCLHNTNYVLTLHNHYPLKWQGSCAPKTINEKVAQLQHYRNKVNNANFSLSVIDDNILRFKKPLIREANHVLRELKFLV